MDTYDYQLNDIVTALSRHSQRATYGAVGGLVRLPPRSVMSGQPKTMENSWIVSKKNKRPTGYLPDEMHPSLEAHAAVISSPQDLAAWLRTHS